MDFAWGTQVAGQLEFYWDAILRPRLEGLTDEEYFWEPVEGCWTLRKGEDGRYVLDGLGVRPPEPAPLTTLAWRLNHVAAHCLANRADTFFGPGEVPEDADMFDPRRVPAELPGTAADALEFLEEGFRAWQSGVTALSESDLRAPLGPKGGPFADDPMLALVMHINRETMHHGAEMCLLRDLFRATGATARGTRLVPEQ